MKESSLLLEYIVVEDKTKKTDILLQIIDLPGITFHDILDMECPFLMEMMGDSQPAIIGYD